MGFEYTAVMALNIGLDFISKPNNASSHRVFMSNFGTHPKVAAVLYNMLKDHKLLPEARTMSFKKILSSLHFLQCYPVNEVGSTHGNEHSHTNTYRYWNRKMIFAISALSSSIINFNNRHSYATGEDYKVTIDGFDMHYFDDYTVKPGKDNVNTCKYSHKLNGAGERWILAISTATGFLSLVSGPYLAGLQQEDDIYKKIVKPKLNSGELVLSDRGYSDRSTIVTSHDDGIPDVIKKRRNNLLARHETMNKRVKSFGCMNTARVRHLDVTYQSAMVRAVMVIIQLEMLTKCWRPFENCYTGPLRG